MAPAMQKLVETQETALIPLRPKLGVFDHVGGPAVGFVVVSTSPLLLPATHSAVELHATAFREWVSIAAGALQVGLTFVGLFEITSWPVLSTATHTPPVGSHETPFSWVVPSIELRELHTGVAFVGLVVITAPPVLSTATQSALPLQDTAVSELVPSTTDRVHVGLAAPGLVETTTPPVLSTATHNPVDGHEIAFTTWVSMLAGALHVGAGAVGFVVVITLPNMSTATHSAVDGHAA